MTTWREPRRRRTEKKKAIEALEQKKGFPLTGWAQASGVFQTRVKPPDFSLEQLEGMAKGLNMAVVASLESSEWMPVDQVAWEETMQEVTNGWLAEKPSSDLGKQFIAKRFPIQQKEKIRLIDDFSIYSAFGMSEKLRVDAIDEILAGISVLLDSEIFAGKNKGLLGRTFDLKSINSLVWTCSIRKSSESQSHFSKFWLYLLEPLAVFRLFSGFHRQLLS